MGCEGSAVQICPSRPFCFFLPKKAFKPQRTQRGTEETSKCVPVRTAASFAFKTFLEIPGFLAELLESTKTCRRKCPGICNVPDSSGHFRKSLRNSSPPHKLLNRWDLTWFEGQSRKLNSAPESAESACVLAHLSLHPRGLVPRG